MAKDDIVRNVGTLGDAVQIVATQHTLTAEALVEFYPARWADRLNDPPARVFAYQFFDRAGGNCAYYLPELRSLHLFATPRRWGMPKIHWEPIEQFARTGSFSAQA